MSVPNAEGGPPVASANRAGDVYASTRVLQHRAEAHLEDRKSVKQVAVYHGVTARFSTGGRCNLTLANPIGHSGHERAFATVW